jgi:hypothetical protein
VIIARHVPERGTRGRRFESGSMTSPGKGKMWRLCGKFDPKIADLRHLSYDEA